MSGDVTTRPLRWGLTGSAVLLFVLPAVSELLSSWLHRRMPNNHMRTPLSQVSASFLYRPSRYLLYTYRFIYTPITCNSAPEFIYRKLTPPWRWYERHVLNAYKHDSCYMAPIYIEITWHPYMTCKVAPCSATCKLAPGCQITVYAGCHFACLYTGSVLPQWNVYGQQCGDRINIHTYVKWHPIPLYVQSDVVWHPDKISLGCNLATARSPDYIAGRHIVSCVPVVGATLQVGREYIHIYIYIYTYKCMYVRMHVCECVSVRMCST